MSTRITIPASDLPQGAMLDVYEDLTVFVTDPHSGLRESLRDLTVRRRAESDVIAERDRTVRAG